MTEEAHRYIVQRHYARHAHYTLHLEVGGALKSWALPKGPTLDPAEKRLAMMLADRPLDGSAMPWDRGTYELLGDATAEEQFTRGDFKFRVHGEKVRGEFAIVRTKRGQNHKGKTNEWLLIKKKDAYAVAGWNPEDHLEPESDQKMPKSVAPMLAEIGRGDPPNSNKWLYEVKWDGYRAICYIDHGRLRMVTRNGNLLEYPELSVLPRHVRAKSAILDAEVVVLDDRGVANFELLQGRHRPAVLYVFDLLYADGQDLRGKPIEERKRLLSELITPSDTIRVSETFEGDGKHLMEAVRAQGIEGIIAKRRGSFYESRRGKDWVKYKVDSSDSFVICGFTKGERDLFGALVLGYYDGAKLRWAGNVGTGFDQRLMKTIHDRIAPLATDKCPLEPEKGLPKRDVTWVRPEVVCEVKYTMITNDHKLRAPVFIGLRHDMDAQPEVKLTNLTKVFFPREGYTKGDLLNYYNAVAPLLVPHLKDRPMSLKRYPNGIEADFFFQKEVAPSFPKWLRKEMAEGIRYVIGEDRATLLFLVNLGCIDHNPWMSRIGSLEHPDYVLIDLDPYHCEFAKIVEAALLVKKHLDRAGLESFPKTTGGDGMHIIVPLEPRYSYAQVRGFAELLSVMVTQERRDLFTTPRAVAKREKGKVYFDWQQIAEGKTISAPYVVRAHAGAPVATPLEWREVTSRLLPDQFHIANAMARFDKVGDLFEGVLKRPQSLEKALERLSK